MITRKEELLASFDAVWTRRWERLDVILKDITEEEAGYQSPVYAGETQWPGEKLPGTVLWFLQHLAQCYINYREEIENRPQEMPDPPAPPADTVAQALESLYKYRSELRELITRLSEEDLDEKISSGSSVIEILRMMIRHDAWHTGQIAVARRLYRMRDK